MYLHEAIVVTLLRNDNGPMTYSQISDSIRGNQFYIRKDRQPPPTGQISARVNKYLRWFALSGDVDNRRTVRIRIP